MIAQFGAIHFYQISPKLTIWLDILQVDSGSTLDLHVSRIRLQANVLGNQQLVP